MTTARPSSGCQVAQERDFLRGEEGREGGRKGGREEGREGDIIGMVVGKS